ncbi:sigma-70 family RNA polymerase sigma factor [Arthrobacter sp. Y-9]|uniref:sigma-70 family RNA polymerase sigma factor n=1 Tax=Arthrobacter sp. Y-9 TaxID=3039385 RepID=UPI00241CDE04|nr:sigma-70 family RNA polymerase sigma factor [Arthrobacter sp. Y-9]WFR84294.1 sigma-70 family RNA polymerase sigma factor [Arthrobacter sp. Y-9]
MSDASDVILPTDGELLEQVRAGELDAYGELFRRHHASALRVARRLTPDYTLAEDAVNDAFTTVLTAIQAGKGPVDVFGPYLISSVSRSMYRMNRKAMREVPVMDTEVLDSEVADANRVVAEFDDAAARNAFRQLADRWREVIWYLDVEGMPPREAAPLLGLSPNATVALHRRAKEALRLGYLYEHVTAQGPEQCRVFIRDIPPYVRGSLRKSRAELLEEHLRTCKTCPSILMQVQEVGPFQRMILPALALLPLAQIYPGQGHNNLGSPTHSRTVSTLAAGATALAIGVALLLIAVVTQLAVAPGPSMTVTSLPSAGVGPQFTITSHHGRIASADLSFPTRSLTPLDVTLDPGATSQIIAVDPPDFWSCQATESGTWRCIRDAEADDARQAQFHLTLGRKPCVAGADFTLTQNNHLREPATTKWPSPCLRA